jgi:hypothetical protein
VSDQHRQATADLVHLRRNAGTEIMITAVCMQLAGVCLTALLSQVRQRARSENLCKGRHRPLLGHSPAEQHDSSADRRRDDRCH